MGYTRQLMRGLRKPGNVVARTALQLKQDILTKVNKNLESKTKELINLRSHTTTEKKEKLGRFEVLCYIMTFRLQEPQCYTIDRQTRGQSALISFYFFTISKY